ncbi:MAG: putative LPS assembly protein LptD [Gemmatimonadota bacterium]
MAALLTSSVLAAPAAAQVGRQQADTVTAEQRAMERLRAMRGVAEPDTVEQADSIPAQTVVVQGTTERTQAPTTQIDRDSIMELLATIPGYTATEYRGEEARFDADSSELVLRTNAMVSREGSELAADSSIVYNESAGVACGYGRPVLTGADMTEPVVSDTVCYNVGRQAGFARGATTRVEEGAQWNVRCNAYFTGDALYCHDAIFTDCEEPWPHQHYHFAADELKVVRGNIMVARDLTMNFRDVPVLWLPFMVQSLSRGRRSGILAPRFGVNDIARTNSRYSRRIEDLGVYWAINEYMGAELAMGWFSGNWTEMRGSLDYAWNDRFLQGGATFRQYWKDEGGSDFTLSARNSWRPDERTNISVTANYATSTSFIERRSVDPRELTRSIDSHGSVRRTFDWGTVSMGASRRQHLSDNTVSSDMPNLTLGLSPITLFEAAPGEDSWYSNATWQGGADFKMDQTSIDASNDNRSAQSRRNLNSGFRSALSVGNFSWSQRLNYVEQERDARVLPDSMAELLPGFAEHRGTWSTGLSYQQRLIGTSAITPNLTVNGEFLQNDSTGMQLVHAPMRIAFGAGLSTDIFGFWPGVGPFAAIRHRMSPSISYSFSPEATADSLQQAVFRRAGAQEQNSISLRMNHTFEAKYRGVDADADSTDTAVADSAAAAAAANGEPRRRQQTQTVQLLSISTNALVYDFVRAREDGVGLQTGQIQTTLRSDLLRGLSVNFTHDLFREAEGAPGAPGDIADRTFAPHLTSLSTSFSLNGDSWLFRILRLGSADTLPEIDGAPIFDPNDPNQAGSPIDRTQAEHGLIGTSRRQPQPRSGGAVGAWNATFDYSLRRPRNDDQREGDQMVNSTFRFQATENWALNWRTGYSFTTSQFTDHLLGLSRSLHDWDANFNFVKAQNGNFSFVFGVSLRANPDIKLDYSQHDMQGLQGRVPRN